MAAADFDSMDEAALVVVIVAIQEALVARNAPLLGDTRVAAKNLVAHRRYAQTALDQAATRLRLCAAHPLGPAAASPNP